MRSILFITSLLLIVNCSIAQNFKWKSDIEPVTQSGFCKVLLQPDINCYMRPGHPDVRVYDEHMIEVPYLKYTEEPVQHKKLFKEYSIVKNEHKGIWGYTRIVIRNPDKSEIRNLSMIIRNADVSKWLKLSGSDDNKNWYVVKDQYYFYSVFSEDSTCEIRMINFPLSNYEYYELLVYDFFNNPIDIQKVGYYDYSNEIGKYSMTAKPLVSQNDSAEVKQSYVKISFSPAQHVDKLKFNIEGPEFYKRSARLQVKKKRVYKKTESWYFETIKNFDLSSNSENSISVSDMQAGDLYLVIDNEDNKSLNITGVEGYQLNTYLKLKFEKDKKYHLRFGDDKISAPVYDLRYFESEIPKELNTLNASAASKLSDLDNANEKDAGLDKIWIWLIVGVVALVLLLMSVKMLKEMKRK